MAVKRCVKGAKTDWIDNEGSEKGDDIDKWSGKKRRGRRANTTLQRHAELQRVVEEKAIAERARKAADDEVAIVERAKKVAEHEREAKKVAEDHDKLCVVCMEEPKHVVLIPCMQHCSSPVICFV